MNVVVVVALLAFATKDVGSAAFASALATISTNAELKPLND